MFQWELINATLKLSLIMLNTYLAIYPDVYKALCALMILFTTLALFEHYRPYELTDFNQLEVRQLIASLVVFYAGVYFVRVDLSS